MTQTHVALAIATTSITLSTADFVTLSLSAIASVLPDVDTTKSLTGRVLFPLSRYFESRFPHRSVTHSFMALTIFAVLTFPMIGVQREYWWALIYGYFWGFFGDIFTKSGVAVFYPSQVRAVCPGNARLRLSTGSSAEYFVTGLLVVIATFAISMNSSGGILKAFNSTMGIPEGAVEIVSNESARYLLSARIIGRAAITQEPVDTFLEVVRPLTQSDILVKNSSGKTYRVGTTQECQIIANRILISRGDKIHSQSKEVQLQEQEIAEALVGVPVTGDRVYINGILILQDAEDLVLSTHADRFNTITLQPGREIAIVRLESASPAEVISSLGEYYGTGSILIRTVEIL